MLPVLSCYVSKLKIIYLNAFGYHWCTRVYLPTVSCKICLYFWKLDLPKGTQHSIEYLDSAKNERFSMIIKTQENHQIRNKKAEWLKKW